jgi:Mg2+ and Co2+ transporter CorA
LQDDLACREHHIKELEETLNCSNKDDLAAKVNELTKSNMKLQRSMQAKQVFSEKLLKENRKLNEIIDQKGINQHLGRDIPDGQAEDEKMIVSCV